MLSRRQHVALLSVGAAVAVTVASAGVLTATPAVAAETRYEAENASASCSGTIDSNHAGYSGSGFCNGYNAVGAAAQFAVNAPAAGTATLAIRHANGTTANRPADIVVNGAVTHAASAFGPTGAWTTWATKTLTVSLNAGANTIRIHPTSTAGLSNIDYVDVAAASSSPSPSPSAPAGHPVLNQVHTVGRVKTAENVVQYSWPGITWEGRFRGTGVGIVLDDSVNHYDVILDGTTVATLAAPGRTTRWINGLANGDHTVRLVKRTESAWSTSAFGGFVAAPGGTILAKPAPRSRQIEFIGDSLTVGYGNLSTTRSCPGNQVHEKTNADVSYGALTARRLTADYQINAYSGRGMVRNYNGGSPDTTYRTYYDRALLHVNGDVWQNPGTWRPHLVVINLGTNDFSTPVRAGEPWTPSSLAAAYRAAYSSFIQKLRARYGADTIIVVAGTSPFTENARQVVQERNSAGDDRVRYWYLDTAGLDYLGCDWHYSARDDRLIADRLSTYIAALPLRW